MIDTKKREAALVDACSQTGTYLNIWQTTIIASYDIMIFNEPFYFSHSNAFSDVSTPLMSRTQKQNSYFSTMVYQKSSFSVNKGCHQHN